MKKENKYQSTNPSPASCVNTSPIKGFFSLSLIINHSFSVRFLTYFVRTAFFYVMLCYVMLCYVVLCYVNIDSIAGILLVSRGRSFLIPSSADEYDYDRYYFTNSGVLSSLTPFPCPFPSLPFSFLPYYLSEASMRASEPSLNFPRTRTYETKRNETRFCGFAGKGMRRRRRRACEGSI